MADVLQDWRANKRPFAAISLVPILWLLVFFIVPKEGSQFNSDNLCIPKGAKRPKNAHAFINYLLDAQAGKKITETILYPTPNAAAKAYARCV